MNVLRPTMAALAMAAPALLASQPATPKTWDEQPAFSVEPSALLAAAGAIPVREDAAIQDLLEETFLTVDEAGREENRYRYVFRQDQATPVSGWSDVNASWSPWFEARPEIRARVITPDGKVHELDPKTIGEYGTEDGEEGVFGDRKRLRAPLPQLTKGAIAEVLIIRRELSPFSKSGVLSRLTLWEPYPTRRLRVEVSVPASAPLHWKVFGLPGVKPVLDRSGGRTRISVDLTGLEARKQPERHLPGDQGLAPQLAFSTVPSWKEPAAEYAAIVEQRLANADLGAWVAEAVGDAKDRDEKIARILARLHKSARYTGIEFGDAAIVPAPPAETLRRGFGDCKDKATLLVGALRAAGIPAEVALLDSGSGGDVDPELPGLSEFNHAIVHVPGPSPLWIDATAEFAHAGESCLGVEGRLAMKASPATTALERIPEMRPESNRQVETREITFGDLGPGAIAETTEAHGVYEQGYRATYAAKSDKQIGEILEKYAKETFSAKAIGAFDYTGPKDLGKPFRIHLDIRQASVANEDRTSAGLTINAWHLVSPLVESLGGLPKDDKEVASKPRLGDLWINQPYLQELRYVIHAPAGYQAGLLPETKTTSFGAASFKQQFEAKPDGTVLATFSLDTGKRIWTPAEVNAGRKALWQFGQDHPFQVLFNQVGEAHLEAGRVKEALDEFHRLALLAPGKAAPLTRYARALLAAGLGEAARNQAARAVELEPNSAQAHQTLAWICQHDLVGRRFGKGWDQARALREYRRAKELDPKDYPIRGDLAILLEYDPSGQRYGAKADLAAAAREYQAIRADLDNHSLDQNLLIVLCLSGRFQEVADLARSMPSTVPGRDSWLTASLVALKGEDEGIQEASRILTDPAARRKAFLAAGDHLVDLRRYSEAARILMEGSQGSDQMSQVRMRAELLRKVHRFDGVPVEPKDPANVVKRMLASIIIPGQLPELKNVFAPSVASKLEKDTKDGSLENARRAFRSASLRPETLLDLTLSLSQFAKEGDDAKGYRIRTRGADGNSTTFFVTALDGGYRLITSTDDVSALGLQVIWCLEHGRKAEAGAWLDEARDHVPAPPADDPVAGNSFARLWTKGQSADEEQIRVAAACLAAGESEDPRPVRILKEARAKARTAQEALPLETAIALASIRAKDWPELLSTTERIEAGNPKSAAATSLRFGALMSARHWEEGLRFSEAHFKEHPELTFLKNGEYSALGRMGQRDRMEAAIQALIDKGEAQSSEYNNLAWSHVVRGSVTEKTLELARMATQSQGSAYAQHTLATVLAELGRTTEAQAALLKEMDSRGLDEPKENEWYVLGRIAEHLGIPDAARDCYAKVKLGPDDDDSEETCHALAVKRLAVLKEAKQP